MANIKTIIKKLVNLGFSENKLMMMTEKEVREAYKTFKEESTMKNHANEVETINSATTVEKEETTMMRTTQELINDALNIKKIQDKKYVTNEMLRAEYQKLTGEVIGNKKTRMVIITKLQEYINQNAKEESNAVSVGDLDITHDNAPESIEESTFVSVEFNDGLATKILEKVIYQADTNRAHNFISDWMLTSIISELIIGLPLKDKDTGFEYHKTFTDEQRKNLIEIRKAFIERTKLIAKYKNSKITGYYIPSKMLVWGRHKYLGVACVYRFMSNNKVAAEYRVSLNGIKNIATGVITALNDDAYATLDSKCVFVM